MRQRISVFIIASFLVAPASAMAQNAESRARSFLDSQTKSILSVAHPEGTLQGITKVVKGPVGDGRGNLVPDHFYLNYEFTWRSGLSGDTNRTELLFFFDKFGSFYAIKAGKTTSYILPFATVDAAIQIFGEIVIRYVDENGTESDKQLARTLVRNANSRELLTLVLRLQQR